MATRTNRFLWEQCAIALIVGTILGIGGTMYCERGEKVALVAEVDHLKEQMLDLRNHGKDATANPAASVTTLLPPNAADAIASFSGTRPISDLNYEWAVLNDNQWHGRSQAWYELGRDQSNGNGFLRIHYSTGEKLGADGVPYCGVYTDFSFPPYTAVDASAFSGLSFKARATAQSKTESVTYVCQICVLGIPNYEYHEYLFSVPRNAEDYVSVTVPFAELRTPSWARGRHEFDPKRIFRISYAVKGRQVSGQLDVDDIRFIK